MNKKIRAYIASSLAVLSCMYIVPHKAIADTTTISLEEASSYMANKDKKDNCTDEDKTNKKDEEKGKDKNKDKYKNDKGSDIFTEENCKYLSDDQKKTLNECKQCKEKGTPLTEDQKKSLTIIIDCIFKGKLGDEKFKDFKNLIEKKQKGTKLTDEEEKKLKEYKNIIENKDKATAADILKQFLR